MKKTLALAATAAVLMLSACSSGFGGGEGGRDYAKDGEIVRKSDCPEI